MSDFSYELRAGDVWLGAHRFETATSMLKALAGEKKMQRGQKFHISVRVGGKTVICLGWLDATTLKEMKEAVKSEKSAISVA